MTTSPTSQTVIDFVFGRVVGKEGLEPGSLPVQILGRAADQVRQVTIDFETLGPRQLLDGFFDFLNRAHT